MSPLLFRRASTFECFFWPEVSLNLSVFDQDGRIPLHYAACSPKSMPLYSMLTNAGSDPTVQDNKEKTVQVKSTRT